LRLNNNKRIIDNNLTAVKLLTLGTENQVCDKPPSALSSPRSSERGEGEHTWQSKRFVIVQDSSSSSEGTESDVTSEHSSPLSECGGRPTKPSSQRRYSFCNSELGDLDLLSVSEKH